MYVHNISLSRTNFKIEEKIVYFNDKFVNKTWTRVISSIVCLSLNDSWAEWIFYLLRF